MSKFMKSLAGFGLVAVPVLAIGCSETSGVKETVEARNPDGSTSTVTKETEVKQTGDNPPPVVPETKPATTP